VIHQKSSAFQKIFPEYERFLMNFVGINVLSIALFKDDFDFLLFFPDDDNQRDLGGPSRFVEF